VNTELIPLSRIIDLPFGKVESKAFIDTENFSPQLPAALPVKVSALTHPLKIDQRIDYATPAGLSLAEIIDRLDCDPTLKEYAIVYVNDRLVPKSQWNRFVPAPGDVVTIRVVAAGGGGGNDQAKTTRIILSIVVLVLALVAGPIVGALINTAFTAIALDAAVTIGTSLIAVGGLLAVNALVPPPRPSLGDLADTRSTNSLSLITGARNRANPFGVIPRPLGKHRMVPPYGALPYSEISRDRFGDQAQFMRFLFIWGYGPLDITDLKVGETPLDQFQDVEIQTIEGRVGDPLPDLFTDSVFEEQLAITITQVGSPFKRTTQTDVEEIVVDILFPQGLVQFGSDGGRSNRTVEMVVQYKDVALPDVDANWSVSDTLSQTFSARVSPKFKDEPFLRQKRFGAADPTQRYDWVALDRFDGTIKIFHGPAVPVGGTISLVFPRRIASWIPLARVFRETDDDNIIDAADITDVRASTEPFGDSDPDTPIGGEFLVTAQTPTATKFVDVAGGDLFFTVLKTKAKTPSAIIRSIHFEVPKLQYDVRISRVTADSSGSKVFDEAVWTVLRSIKHTPPVTLTGVAMTAIRIKATDQLRGVIDSFNGVVTSIIKDWDGAAWVERGTENPASMFREILEGPGNKRPVAEARLDLVQLQTWHDFCDTTGFSFNQIVDFQSTVRDMLQAVASAGRASLTIIDGKWSVVIDDAQTIIRQHLTPRNTAGFEGEQFFPEQPHAFRVRFANEDSGYEIDERIVYDDGFTAANATKFEVLEFPGITNKEQVWKLARYFIAVGRLRRRRFTVNLDVEHLACTRGDLVKFAGDVPLIGQKQGRITVVNVDGGGNATDVDLDDPVLMTLGLTYDLRFRRTDGTTFLAAVDTNPGVQTNVVFTTIIPPASIPTVGDLFFFGQTSLESIDAIVLSVEPGGDLTARLVLIDYSPAVFTADSGTIPAFNSQITIPPGGEKPFIKEVRSDENVLLHSTDGTFQSRILVTLAATTNISAFVDKVQAQFRIKDTDEPFVFAPDMPRETKEISLIPVEDGITYEFRLRYEFLDNRFGEWTVLQDHTVIGKTSPPSDVTGFMATLRTTGVELTWNEIPDLDRDSYEVRLGSTWAGSSFVANVTATTYLTEVFTGARTYLIKALDSARPVRNESVNAASVTVTPVVPSTPVLSVTFDGAAFVLSWPTGAGTFPISHYEVRKGGASWSAATVVAERILTTWFRREVTFTGAETWRVTAYGVGGGVSGNAEISVSPGVPSVSTPTATVIDNIVLLGWTGTKGSLNIAKYDVRKGAVFSSATVLTLIDSLGFLIMETAAGTFTYWIQPIDTAGNVGTEKSITVKVDAPPDFVFHKEFVSDFSNRTVLTDLWVTDLHDPNEDPPSLSGPSIITRTYQQHFDDNTWASVQAAITDGFTVQGQDGTNDLSGLYEEEFDVGVVVPDAKVIVEFVQNDLQGSVTVTTIISTKETVPDPWTDHPAGKEALASNFRYIKIQFTVASDTDTKDYTQLTGLTVTVRVKEITDEGVVNVTANPTTVTVNKTFANFTAIELTPQHASLPRIAVYETVSSSQFRVRLFDDTGAAQTGNVSWIVRGF